MQAHVIVIGAGVIGATSAYVLAKRGYQVTLLERQPEAGRETSYANAGEITAGIAAPWSGPGMPLKVLKWAFDPHSPMRWRPAPDSAMFAWIIDWWRNCSPARYRVNKTRMVALANYSLRCMQQLRSELDLHYDQRALGTLHLFRTPAQMLAAENDIRVLEALGVRYQRFDRAACLVQEPGLAAGGATILGGTYFPDDETGDCFSFTRQLANAAAACGVELELDVTVKRLKVQGQRVQGVETEHGVREADAVLLACGSYTNALLKPLGLRLPVYPLKGFSITAPIVNVDQAPHSTLLDESSKVAITRLGDRVRAGGIAELVGYDLHLDPARRETLVNVVRSLYGDAADMERADYWCGLRPVTPDGPPIMGQTPCQNLYVNTGHGSYGWTMAAGSAAIVADQMEGKTPAIATDGMRWR